MSRTKFVKKLNEEIVTERQKDYEFNKPFVTDFITDLKIVKNVDKRIKWFNLDNLIKTFVAHAYTRDKHTISFDRYLYKYGIDDVVIQEKLRNFYDMYGNKPMEWYKAKYYADMYSKDSNKKAKSIWLKLYAFLLFEKIKDKYFKYDKKVHIDKLIEFLEDYNNGKRD